MRKLLNRQGSAMALVLLVVWACAGDPATRATAALDIACNAVNTLVSKAIPGIADGSLSDGRTAIVVSVRDRAAPLCGTASVVNPAAAVQIVESLLTEIRKVMK